MRKHTEPYTYKQGYAYKECNNDSSDIYMGDMYIPFDTKLIPSQNGGLLQVYRKRKNQKIHIFNWNSMYHYLNKREILSLNEYFSKIEQDVKEAIENVYSNYIIKYSGKYYVDTNAIKYIFNTIESAHYRNWRKGFSKKREELYRKYHIDVDFAKEMARILEETKETIKNDIDSFLIGTSGMHHYDICNVLFMSDKPRTYDNLTETEKFLLKCIVEYAMKADSDYITEIAVMKEDGVLIPVSAIDDNFFHLLFD